MAVWQADHNQTISTDIYPLAAFAIRNPSYKLVVNNFKAYDTTSNACITSTVREFYQINENVPVPELDNANLNLLASGNPLNRQQQKNYDSLSAQLTTLLASQPACPGDINLDGVVNYLDVAELNMFQGHSSSWADVNLDGLTDSADLAIILQNFGSCPARQAAQIPGFVAE